VEQSRALQAKVDDLNGKALAISKALEGRGFRGEQALSVAESGEKKEDSQFSGKVYKAPTF
jgi:hypothetical protein